jgi:hypothetical protein
MRTKFGYIVSIQVLATRNEATVRTNLATYFDFTTIVIVILMKFYYF